MITKEGSNYIKLVAMLAMLLDHIGAFLIPWEILRIIGRLSFPLFAYQLGIGYSATSSKKKYLIRLIGFGIVSQVPFALLAGHFIMNILFSLALGIVAIWSLENRKFILVVPIIFLSFFVEYGLYGLITILIFYFLKDKIRQFGFFALATFIYGFYYQAWNQIYAIFSLFFIGMPKVKINIPKNLFYFFYPLHLVVIYLIKTLFL